MSDTLVQDLTITLDSKKLLKITPVLLLYISQRQLVAMSALEMLRNLSLTAKQMRFLMKWNLLQLHTLKNISTIF